MEDTNAVLQDPLQSDVSDTDEIVLTDEENNDEIVLNDEVMNCRLVLLSKIFLAIKKFTLYFQLEFLLF